MASYELLSVDSNAKTPKGEALGWLTGVLYLAPHAASGTNVCPMASIGCINACLGVTAGMVAFTPSVMKSRIKKTREYFDNRPTFLAKLCRDIARLIKAAEKRGLRAAVRLNGTSDILWERVRLPNGNTLMQEFSNVHFYDYTKHNPAKRTELPQNYTLTFSLSEATGSELRAAAALTAGWNVAVVFRVKSGKALPETFTLNGTTLPVLDGDESDTRFLDRGNVIGLHAKGAAFKDTSGFVREAT